MSLSIKAVQAMAPPVEEAEVEPVEDDAPRPYQSARTAPLKGGTNKSTGGEKFGLNW